MPALFDHARTCAGVDDPGGYLRDRAADGTFDRPCPVPGGSPAAPLPGNRLPVVPVVTGALAALLGVSAVIAVAAGGTGGSVAALVLAVLAAGAAVAATVALRRHRGRLAVLATARDNGWLRYAPARVGAVWVDRVVRHGPATGRGEERGRNQEVRYWYRAAVEVLPTDGTEPFRMTTAPFLALADRDGVPVGIRSAPGALDAWEPEYANGWTIARYLADVPEQSATVTTNLSPAQVADLLEDAGIR